MITFDKLDIRFKKMFRNLLFHFIFWYGSFVFYIFLTGEENIFLVHLNMMDLEDLYVVILVLSGNLSLLFALLDGLFSERILRFFPIRMMLFLKSLLYFLSVFVLLLLVNMPQELTQKDFSAIWDYLPGMNIHLIRFLVYFYVCIFLFHLLKGTISRIGKGNFRNWLLGLFSKPIEQERIFMFVDMKSSTSIAEKMDHKKFSHLIQDVFRDMEVVDNYRGEIYQYLGDGAIISWSLKKGLSGNNFLKAFYAFQKAIRRRRRYYKRKYGQEPAFKAGVHSGKVMVLQVGQIRRDISYNGDTINTAARIESKCNEYKQDLLISGDLYHLITHKNGFQFRNLGKVKLNGKSKGIEIYKVRKK